MLGSVDKSGRSARLHFHVPLLRTAPFHGPEKDVETVKSYIGDAFGKITRPAGGLLPYPYLIPTAPSQDDPDNRLRGIYLQMYDWDAFFEGARLCGQGKPEFLKNVVLNFLSQTQKNGHTPRTISPERTWDEGDQCKPFLCQGALLASRALRDASWVRGETYKKLKQTLRYWETHRLTKDGLFVWRNAVESGIDNSVPLLLARPMSLAGVDLNCYMVREYRVVFPPGAGQIGRSFELIALIDGKGGICHGKRTQVFRRV